MEKPKIVKTIDLPSTNNSWGFGGSRKKQSFIIDNNDIWVSGIACYRRLDDCKYIKLVRNDIEILDVELKGKVETFIAKYYDRVIT